MNMKNRDLKGAPGILGVSLILLIVLIISVMVAVTIGSVDISVKQVYEIIANKAFGIGSLDHIEKRMTVDIVWFLRLPRLILALAIGMLLSVCGVAMQAILKNPLADPYVLGLSSGASLGATLAILLGLGGIFGQYAVGGMAFLGAFIVALLVVGLSMIGGQTNSVRLLLSGMALSTMCSAFSSFIIFIADDAESIRTITYWLMGSVAAAKWEVIVVVLPVAILLLFFFMTQYRTLNMMLLGDEVAITLGKNLKTYRIVYLMVVAFSVGVAVFASGMIGFVGLIIPHVVRMFVGSDHKKVLVFSALLGGIFLVWADVACRVIIPGSELPIGVLTSLIGGPFFVYLLARRSYGFGGA
jgi:iron complex transport system permease protein